MSTEEMKANSGVSTDDLWKLPIRITLTMSAKQWEGFVVSANKTGGELQRRLAEDVIPHLDMIKTAIDLIKGKEPK